jgi:RecJ-like exonuclease
MVYIAHKLITFIKEATMPRVAYIPYVDNKAVEGMKMTDAYYELEDARKTLRVALEGLHRILKKAGMKVTLSNRGSEAWYIEDVEAEAVVIEAYIIRINIFENGELHGKG